MRKNETEPGMQVAFHHEITMRDGVILRGDLYRPALQGKYPVILMRTIFRKKTLSRGWGCYDPSFYVKHGYAVYIQDVRGLGDSDGRFVRFTADGADGYDTIEYLGTQPWSNGNVGMYGDHYVGFLQFQAAARHPPHLKAICPFQTHVTLNRNNDTRGFPQFYAHVGWCMAREMSRLVEGKYSAEIIEKYGAVLRDYLMNYSSIVRDTPAAQLPMAELREAFSIVDEYFTTALPCYDDMQAIKREGRLMDLDRLEVPALLLSGWQEDTRNTMIGHGDILRRTARGNARQSEVVIGPWAWGEPMSQPENALYIPENHFSVEQELLRWFDKWLKEKPVEEKKPFRLYNAATGSFVELGEWKDNGNAVLCLYLRSKGAANTRLGDGCLTPAPLEDGVDEYIYDPENPMLSMEYGADCQTQEDREDVLVYTSDILQEQTDVLGVIRTELFASSLTPDTDFMVHVLDVTPAGQAILVGAGAARAKYRESWTPVLLEEGKPYAFTILCGNVVYSFLKGHRIRVEITSSDFPHFQYNRNTGARPEQDSAYVKTRNRIYHGAAMPSRVMIPLA